jgi:hypothetical protein
MPQLNNLHFEIDADAILRAQGGDPEAIRARRPEFVELADYALAEAQSVLEPRVIYERRAVRDVLHNRLRLEDGIELTGSLVVEHLAPADEIVAILCTVGSGIEAMTQDALSTDPVYGLALDAVGSATVEALSVAACRYFELEAETQGIGSSVPLSPGMDNWPVGEGQPQLFKLLPAQEIGVSLTEGCLMQPAKSLTLILGIGANVNAKGTVCDYCAVRNTCRYRELGGH